MDSEFDIDPGPPILELRDYGLQSSERYRRSLLARVEQREQVGTTIEFALGGFAELTFAYATCFAPAAESSTAEIDSILDFERESPWNKP